MTVTPMPASIGGGFPDAMVMTEGPGIRTNPPSRAEPHPLEFDVGGRT